MKRLLIPFIALGILFAALVPVSAGDVPLECIPDPSIEYRDGFYNRVDVVFSLKIGVDCPLDNDWMISPPFEITHVAYGIEHKYRIGQTTTWNSEVVISHSSGSGSFPPSNGSYYELGTNAFVEVTGEAFGLYHEYRMFVTVSGRWYDPNVGTEGEIGFGYGEVLEKTFYTSWMPGPDAFEVLEPFRDRPGELIPLPDPTHGTLQPTSLKSGTSR